MSRQKYQRMDNAYGRVVVTDTINLLFTLSHWQFLGTLEYISKFGA